MILILVFTLIMANMLEVTAPMFTPTTAIGARNVSQR